VLTLAGDLSPARAMERVELYFGSIPRGPEAAPAATSIPAATDLSPPAADLPPLGGERRARLEDDVQLPRVYFGFRLPPYGERDWYAADLLAMVLTSGKSSLLYHDLVYRRQLAQDVGASVYPTELCATFALVATARPEVSADELEAAIAEHLDRAMREPVADEHVERARNLLLTGYFQELQKLDGRADLFSQFTTLFDDPGRIATEPSRYDEITARDLAACAASWLAPDQRVVVSVVPRGTDR
jgi:zinc protease